MPYNLVEEVAIADACYDLTGETIEELFHSGFEAVTDTMVDLSTVKTKKEKTVKLERDTVEDLLFDFLEEIVYLKDAERMVYRECDVSIDLPVPNDIAKKQNEKVSLLARLKGQELNDSITTKTDVKAITYYQFRVEKDNDLWKARVTLDL